MIFTIPKSEPRLSKEFLLSKNSEETYMTTYLGRPLQKGLFRSPLRDDHKPTCSVYRNKGGSLIFHDFGTGAHFNFIEIVMERYKCSYHEALKIIAQDFGLIERTTERPAPKIIEATEVIEEKKETILQIQEKPFSENELKWWKTFGISKETLKKFHVHSCDSIFINGQYAGSSSTKSFMFGYYGGRRNGQELWRIYMPQKKTFRFLSNWDKEIIQGSKIIPTTGDLLIITKSLKDCMALYELGFNAIAPNSEAILLHKSQMAKLHQRFKTIVALGDNDRPGIAYLNKLHKKFPEVKCLFIPRSYGAKDVSDLIKKIGIDKVKEEIEKARKFLNV